MHEKGELTVKRNWLCREWFTDAPTHSSYGGSSMGDREMIGAVLAETRGRVSGPLGAAARLGIPPSTLESRIRSMNINKYQFKMA